VLQFVGAAVFFSAALFATPILDVQPPPPAGMWWAPAMPPSQGLGPLAHPHFSLTVPEAGILSGVVFRHGGPFNPPPLHVHPRPVLGLPEPFAFGLLGLGAAALGFAWRPARRRSESDERLFLRFFRRSSQNIRNSSPLPRRPHLARRGVRR
jgi:hypothetical protein